MTRRILAALAAIVLAGVGAFVLLDYVSAADARAMAGLESQTVLVTTEPVAEGTPVDELTELVTTEELPVKAVGPGALSDLGEAAGRVTATDLGAGEQLLTTRFVDPDATAGSRDVEVPEGMHEITLQLPIARVLGGHLTAGDTVGIFSSVDGQTNLLLHKVLVTRVSGGVPLEETDVAVSEEPAEVLTVTLALDAPDAESLVFTLEHGSVWLSLEPEGASESGTRVVTPENIF